MRCLIEYRNLLVLFLFSAFYFAVLFAFVQCTSILPSGSQT